MILARYNCLITAITRQVRKYYGPRLVSLVVYGSVGRRAIREARLAVKTARVVITLRRPKTTS